MRVIELRRYRWDYRTARVEIVEGTANIYLPQYFTEQPWSVPLSGTAVVDVSVPPPDPVNGEDDGPLFEPPVAVPYLATTTPFTDPTICLLFGQPQRVPPLRFGVAQSPFIGLPFGFFRSRSQDGGVLDGVLLRAVDPKAAVAELVAAGAEQPRDVNSWLAARRAVVTDPDRRAAILARLKRGEKALRLAGWTWLASVGTAVAGVVTGMTWALVAALVLGVTANGALILAGRSV